MRAGRHQVGPFFMLRCIEVEGDIPFRRQKDSALRNTAEISGEYIGNLYNQVIIEILMTLFPAFSNHRLASRHCGDFSSQIVKVTFFQSDILKISS